MKYFLLMISLLSLNCYADDMIVDFTDNSVPVLNEELRRLQRTAASLNSSVSSIDRDRVLMWYIGGDAETGTNVSARLTVPFSGTIRRARAYSKTAPTGSALIFDINKNGTSIWGSTQGVQIAAGENTGNETSFDTTSVAVDDYFTLDIDQIGSSTAGADITVELIIDESGS